MFNRKERKGGKISKENIYHERTKDTKVSDNWNS